MSQRAKQGGLEQFYANFEDSSECDISATTRDLALVLTGIKGLNVALNMIYIHSRTLDHYVHYIRA